MNALDDAGSLLAGAPLAAEPEIQALVRAALAEDVGRGDATSLALVEAGRQARATIIARHAVVAAGLEVARAVFAAQDPEIQATPVLQEGAWAAAGTALLDLRGPARSILTAERTALNFLQRLCGIATLTRRFVDRTAPYGVAILDTRKTTPTLRRLEKAAVRAGGGQNHRFGLFDRVMIKDNHRRLAAGAGTLGLARAVALARERFPDLAVEVEVESMAQLEDALQGRPDWVLLDNMPPPLMEDCVRRVNGACRVEASGGITLDTVEAVAATGVDAISLGCLTHSAPAADLSLEFSDATEPA